MPPKKAAKSDKVGSTVPSSDGTTAKTPRKRKADNNSESSVVVIAPTNPLQPFLDELGHSESGRQFFREIFVKTLTEFDTEIEKERETRSLPLIREKFFKLTDVRDKISKYDDQVMLLMLKCKKPNALLQQESASVDELYDKWVNAKVKADSVLINSNSDSVARVSDSKKKALKFERVKVQEFNGDLLQWLPFWSQYKPFHEDPEVDDATKFTFLKQHIAEGNRARTLVDSFSQHTAENYPKMIAALQDRFGDEKILRQVYVQDLLNMVLQKGKGDTSIGIIYDKLRCHIDQLETLGVSTSQFSLFLYPMVQAAIPDDMVKEWQKDPFYEVDGTKLDPPQTDMQMLMDFLKKQVKYQQQRSLTADAFKSSDSKRYKVTEDYSPTAASLFSTKVKEKGTKVEKAMKCIFCNMSNHMTSGCKNKKFSIEEKRKCVRENGLCYICLIHGHKAFKCNRRDIKCIVCGRRHYAVVCSSNKPNHGNQTSHKGKNGSEKAGESNDGSGTSTHAASTAPTNCQASAHVCRNDILLDVEVVRIFGADDREKVIRLFYDRGAQSSCILKRTAEQMNCKKVGNELLYTAVFGGVTTELKDHAKYMVKVASFDYKVKRNLTVLDEDDITGILPRIPYREDLDKELKKRKIFPSDLKNKSPEEEIEILIGCDLYPHLVTGKTIKLDCGLIATQTIFGWTLSGPLSGQCSQKSSDKVSGSCVRLSCPLEKAPDPLHTAMMSVFHVPSLWSLDVIGIKDPAEHKTKKEHNEIVKQNVISSITRNSDGRYSVGLPWAGEKQIIPNNFNAAKAILESVTKTKLNTELLFNMFDKVLQQWLLDDYVEVVEEDGESKFSHYLPHHPVFKPASQTTPCRPVFNASFRLGRSPSLNMILEKGENLLELIPSVLLRFREKKVGAVADIKQAFLQIEIAPEDRDYLRFLWWDNKKEKVVVYRHKRVVFGVTSSPFLLMIVIFHHLSQVSPELKSVAFQLWSCLYVDNFASSFNSTEEYLKFKEISMNIMSQAKMDLRLWHSSHVHEEAVEKVEIQVSVLGLNWNTQTDTLNCIIPRSSIPDVLTKRQLASEVQKIYDPCGFLSPTLLIPKLALRDAWKEGKKWNESISGEIQQKFIAWKKEAHLLSMIKIPRHIQLNNSTNLQLHTFCDSSSVAYAAAVFLRSESGESIAVNLLLAKVRVAPLQNISISRLELLAGLIGLRLTVSVKEALNYDNITTTLWTDSSNVLSWIRRNDKWGTFVGNRVKEILDFSHPDQWRYVPTDKNPADLPSRGCSPSQLLAGSWWEGPAWLRESPDKWPNIVPLVNESDVNQEKRKTTLAVTVACEPSFWYLPYNSYWKNVTVMAYILKWRHLIKRKRHKGSGILPLCYEDAEIRICKLVQSEAFKSDAVKVNGIAVEHDDAGILRVKTKLVNRDDTEYFRSPMLLPANHKFTHQMIHWQHNFYGHGSPRYVMNRIRERFWILKASKVIKKIVHSCLVCKRYRTKAPDPTTSAPPKDRVQAIKPFSTIGIDLGGPLFLKDNTKVWFVLFTCSVYRAIHLELCQSLSTKAFLMAFSRFTNNRGRTSTAYTDNGSNFRGSDNLCRELNWAHIQEATKTQRIKFKFQCPASPWWGGFFERLIGMTKNTLKRMLGNKRLGYVELETILSEVAAIINSRPLTYVGEDTNDLIPLTPAMFIQPIPDSSFPENALITVETLQQQYKNLGVLRDELESRFRNEYLSLLVQTSGNKPETKLKEGDIVLVGMENKKRQLWPMARIIEMIKGRDGTLRLARVQLPHSYGLEKDEKGTIKLDKVHVGTTLLRPLRKLYPLEFSRHEPVIDISADAQSNARNQLINDVRGYVTRFGRTIVVPQRLQL